jgi:hypothetical protein
MVIKKGKKTLTQNSFKKFLFLYAKKGKKNSNLLFKKCFYFLRPYVALKMVKRKRGKRIIYKPKFLREETTAEKKAMLSFGKFMKEPSNTVIRFVNRLNQVFQTIANNKKHILRLKRNNNHNIALKTLEFVFKKPKFSFEKSNIKLQQEYFNKRHSKKFNLSKVKIKKQRKFYLLQKIKYNKR